MASRRRVIVHSNTHFTRNPFDEQQNRETIHLLAQSQAQTLEGKIGVDGKELIHPETPKVNGFSFVKTPSPAPGMYSIQDVGRKRFFFAESTVLSLFSQTGFDVFNAVKNRIMVICPVTSFNLISQKMVN